MNTSATTATTTATTTSTDITTDRRQPSSKLLLQAQSSSFIKRRFRSKTPDTKESASSWFGNEKKSSTPMKTQQQQPPPSPSPSPKAAMTTLSDLHSELQVLASNNGMNDKNNNGVGGRSDHGGRSVGNTNDNVMNGTGAIRRLLKGKKLIRVVKKNRSSTGRNHSDDTLESHPGGGGGGGGDTNTTNPTTDTKSTNDDGTGRKVLRVKVKRKKKEDITTQGGGGSRGGGSNKTSGNMSVTDVDSMAPTGALRPSSGRKRRGKNAKSDASVGTGIISKAKSWFTFGGMKVGSGGRDFLGVEDDDNDDDNEDGDDDDDHDDLLLDGGRTEYGDDDYTNADARTALTTTPPRPPPEQQPSIDQDETKHGQQLGIKEHTLQQQQQPKLVSSLKTTTAKTSSSPPTTTAPTTTTYATPELKPTTIKTESKAYMTSISPKSPSRSKQQQQQQLRKSTSSQSRAPVHEIIPEPGVPKKQPLTGVALRRLQIQEEWLSKGCNYQPNEFLRSTLIAAQVQQEGQVEVEEQDVSEISYDEPMILIMGPDASDDGEVDFWTHTTATVEATYGSQHDRTVECVLNQGVAALNTRQTSRAIECFSQAVNACQDREKYGDSILAAARALHLLGSAFFLEGQLPMAAEATIKSLEIRKVTLGPYHTDTVDTFSNLAMVYLKQGKLMESARIFTEVIQIRTAIYNAWHPSVAFPARSLAAVHAKRKDKDRARESYMRALQCFERHGMLAERRDTESEMRRFGISPPVEEKGRTEI